MRCIAYQYKYMGNYIGTGSTLKHLYKFYLIFIITGRRNKPASLKESSQCNHIKKLLSLIFIDLLVGITHFSP
jgi:hypothetical protein